MKSGNTKRVYLNAKIDLNRYRDRHKIGDCKGEWQFTFTPGKRFTVDALGPISIPWIPLLTCHQCHTSFELPKYREFVEHTIAQHLITSKALLTKQQVKFLRLFFDKTQVEFAKSIGVSDKHEMSKIESVNDSRTLDPDRQVRLRLYCAKLLQIEEASILYGMNEIDKSISTDIPVSIFPKTEEETKAVMRRLQRAS